MTKYRFLVEEHTSGVIAGVGENITFHLVVIAQTAQLAFSLADRAYAEYRGAEFIFSESDLTERIPNYLWQATDGSVIWYEVRKLEKVPEYMQSGPKAAPREAPEDSFVINPYWEDKT